MRVVIDASAAVQIASTRIGFAGISSVELVAPPIMWSEAVSALHHAMWRRAISPELADKALAALLASGITGIEPEGHLAAAWRLASDLGWARTYDAEYVAVAQILDLPILTRDERLRRGADRIVAFVSPADLA